MADEESSGALKPGTLVGGRFKIDRLLGRGGMGEVYAARHAATGKEVALKLIRPSSVTFPMHELARRFIREARAATAIQHPNIIEVFDVFIDSNGTPVMVMELLKGESLHAYRTRRGALHLHEIATVMVPALEGLRAAHEKGVVHRDLKPDNIFLAETPGGRVTKVLDFGIAKVLDPGKLGSNTEGPHTRTNAMLGTPHYMSFEQAMSDKTIDQRADIWAVGVIIFEALSGRRPIEFETLGEMYTALLKGTVPSVGTAVPDLPRDVHDVIDRCLQKDRTGRLADLGPLIDVLRRYADSTVAGALAGGTVVGPLAVDPLAAAPTEAAVSSGVPRQSAHRAGRRIAAGALLVLALLSIGVAFGVRARSTLPATRVALANAPEPPSSTSAPVVSASAASATDALSGVPTPTAQRSAGPVASTSPPATAGARDGGRSRPRIPPSGESSSHGIAPTLPY
jgi:hypothetical protein